MQYDIKELTTVMMQKLEPRTVGLKPTKLGHVDRVSTGMDSVAPVSRGFAVRPTYISICWCTMYIAYTSSLPVYLLMSCYSTSA